MCMLSHFSHVRLCVTPWTAACRAPLSTGFSRQEYWSGFPCPLPGDLPDPGTEPTCLISTDIGRWVFFYHQHHLGSPTMRRHSSANQGWALNRQLICSYFVLDVPLWNILNFSSKPAQSRVICYGSPNKDWRACIFLLWHPLRPSVRIHSGTLQHDSKRVSFNSLEMGLYLTHSVYVWEVFAHHNSHKSYYLKKSIPAK